MRRFALALVMIGLAVTALAAQSHFSARSDLVVLNVAVTNARGGFVSGLEAGAFHVIEEGRPQKVSFFAEQDAPSTIGLLIDSSGSMMENRDRIIAGVTEFAKSSHPDDEFLPLVFNEQVSAVLPPGKIFTDDPGELQTALARSLIVRGRTAFHDAVAKAVDGVSRGRHERKALVILSDGGDNASRLAFNEAFERVLSSNVVIYSIALVDPLTLDRNPKALRRLADGTGGLAYEPVNVSLAGKAFQAISRDIRSRYTLAYEPGSGAGGALRHVRVTVDAPGQPGLKVRTRTGYLAGTTDEEPDEGAQ